MISKKKDTKNFLIKKHQTDYPSDTILEYFEIFKNLNEVYNQQEFVREYIANNYKYQFSKKSK